jgi:hypothetical protein
LQYIGFWLAPYIPTMYQAHTFWAVVTSPVTGRSAVGELMRRDPQLLVTSVILGGTEAHSHIAPTKHPSETSRKPLEAILVAVLCE